MARPLTRRQAIASIGGTMTLSATGASATATAEPDGIEAESIVETDLEATYPKCVYKRDDDEWGVSMPINVHAVVPGEKRAIAVVEDQFTGLTNLEWTPVFPDSATRAWDDGAAELVRPALSIRRPRLGDEWVHVHAWPVDANRVAIHAHLDVFDVTASHLHRGDYYGDAAEGVAAQFSSDDWTSDTSHEIEYGVDSERADRWGETGDTKIEYQYR
ncbi:hypothetical protein [Halobiforma nitratireducens]|uniref:Uncharacterized protein n=1 Tax=Halobiforma nitratireducens JCM 10879 TaxID=1227454 RepID=M0M1K5_9EURY|nr:hypothetical protein [Halobiforma nitratireducens]EMA39707.1 hypothetical protein C446_08256 [Halobiforma nitratireducens JCM 10879]